MRRLWLLAVFGLALPVLGKVDVNFDHYFNAGQVLETLQKLNKAYPDFTELRSIGKSEEGRDVWLFTINNAKTGSDLDKPGVYVDGTIHGNEIQATEVCLYLAWYLLEKYESIPMIRELIDTRVFYIIPVVNVDSRARFFEDAGGYNIGRTARVPFDDDRDGLKDEDDSEDLNGDGEILEMRIRDPFGGWKTHPEDPRVMIRVKPGELGEWRLLGDEGIDNDGDGRINEDTPGYLDMNRNFAYKWQPPYVQQGAGEYPFSAKNTRAISDFILTKPNICFTWAFHNFGGLIVRGPGSKLAGMYPPTDVRVYDYLGQEGEKIVPGYKYVIGMKDMYTTYGDFDEWIFCNIGSFAFVGELFRSEDVRYRKPAEGEKEKENVMDLLNTEDLEVQKFNDNLTHGSMFTSWKPFKHPQFGEIEIGGWRKFTTRMPPPFMLQDMVHRNASAVIFTARHTPLVKLELLEKKDLGNGLSRIRVRAINMQAIPTISARALSNNLVRKDILTIEGKGVQVVSGGILFDPVMDNVQNMEHRPDKIFANVPGFGKTDVQWIVKGKGQVTVNFNSLKTTDRTLTITL